jgi:hypothetical protein
MNIIQFCWLLFVFLGMYILIYTKWSFSDYFTYKLFASFFVSGLLSFILFVVLTIFKFLGE